MIDGRTETINGINLGLFRNESQFLNSIQISVVENEIKGKEEFHSYLNWMQVAGLRNTVDGKLNGKALEEKIIKSDGELAFQSAY